MSGKLKAGVIGTGIIGKHHLNNYAGIADAEVVAVCDINKEAAQAAAEQFGVEQVFSDHTELLKMAEIDVVDVCLPNVLHCSVTCDALKAGKHVYCEKPFANSAAEARKMVKTAQDNDRLLAMQLGTLFSKEARAAKRLIDAGRLGRIYYAKASNYRRRGRPYVDGYATPIFVQKEHAGGGALPDMGVYHLGLMMYLLDNPEIETVSASTFQELDMDEGRRKSSGYDVEELATALVRFSGDITLMFEEAWAAHMDGGTGHRIMGSKGGLKLEPFAFFTNMEGIDGDTTFLLDQFETRQNSLLEDWAGYANSQQHFAWSVLGRVPQIRTDLIGLKVCELTEMMYKSAHQRKEIRARKR